MHVPPKVPTGMLNPLPPPLPPSGIGKQATPSTPCPCPPPDPFGMGQRGPTDVKYSIAVRFECLHRGPRAPTHLTPPATQPPSDALPLRRIPVRLCDLWEGHSGGGPLTRKRHIPPHSAQPQHTNHWALRTRKRHQQEHRPQRPTERSDPTQHAKGRPGDCPGPRKGATTRRNVTQGGGGGRGLRQGVNVVGEVAFLRFGAEQSRPRSVLCAGGALSCSVCCTAGRGSGSAAWAPVRWRAAGPLVGGVTRGGEPAKGRWAYRAFK